MSGPRSGGTRGPEPSEEELQAALEEQMRQITVPDVLVQTVVTLVNLAGRRLGLSRSAVEGGEPVDLDEGRLAIEGTRALLPLLPPDTTTPIREALTQLQMAYVQLAQSAEPPAGAGVGGAEPAGAPPAPTPGAPPSDPSPPASPSREEAERARARSRIWTPPGT